MRFALAVILALAAMADHHNVSTWHDALIVMRHAGVSINTDEAQLPRCDDPIEAPDEYDLTTDI